MTNKNLKSLHLGNGAYCTFDDFGGIVLTANHHNPHLATDVVYIDSSALVSFLRLIKKATVPTFQESVNEHLCSVKKVSDITKRGRYLIDTSIDGINDCTELNVVEVSPSGRLKVIQYHSMPFWLATDDKKMEYSVLEILEVFN